MRSGRRPSARPAPRFRASSARRRTRAPPPGPPPKPRVRPVAPAKTASVRDRTQAASSISTNEAHFLNLTHSHLRNHMPGFAGNSTVDKSLKVQGASKQQFTIAPGETFVWVSDPYSSGSGWYSKRAGGPGRVAAITAVDEGSAAPHIYTCNPNQAVACDLASTASDVWTLMLFQTDPFSIAGPGSPDNVVKQQFVPSILAPPVPDGINTIAISNPFAGSQHMVSHVSSTAHFDVVVPFEGMCTTWALGAATNPILLGPKTTQVMCNDGDPNNSVVGFGNPLLVCDGIYGVGPNVLQMVKANALPFTQIGASAAARQNYAVNCPSYSTGHWFPAGSSQHGPDSALILYGSDGEPMGENPDIRVGAGPNMPPFMPLCRFGREMKPVTTTSFDRRTALTTEDNVDTEMDWVSDYIQDRLGFTLSDAFQRSTGVFILENTGTTPVVITADVVAHYDVAFPRSTVLGNANVPTIKAPVPRVSPMTAQAGQGPTPRHARLDLCTKATSALRNDGHALSPPAMALNRAMALTPADQSNVLGGVIHTATAAAGHVLGTAERIATSIFAPVIGRIGRRFEDRMVDRLSRGAENRLARGALSIDRGLTSLLGGESAFDSAPMDLLEAW